jgi:hypothetical protein
VQDVFGLSAAIVLSLRQLIGANNQGNLITIRQTQTSATPNEDFGATLGNEVDFAAIATYGGGTTVGVENMIDGSGNNVPITRQGVNATTPPLLDTIRKRIFTARRRWFRSEPFVFDEGGAVTFVLFGDFEGSATGTGGAAGAYHVFLIFAPNFQTYQIRFRILAGSNTINIANIASNTITNERTHVYTGGDEGLIVLRIEENGNYNLQFFNGTGGNNFNSSISNRLTDTSLKSPLPDFRFVVGAQSGENDDIAPFYFNTAMFYKSYLTDGQVQQLKNLFNVT